MIEEHLAALPAQGYASATMQSAASWLHHLQSFFPDRDLAQLSAQDLELWQKELSWTPGPRGRIYSPNTVNQAVGAVRRFYRWLLSESRIGKDPTKTLKTARNRTPQKAPDSETIRKLLAAPDRDTPLGIRDRAVLGVLLETKTSAGACSRLDLEHLCLDTGALLTQGRVRQIHSLSAGLLADLERYLRESRPLLLKDPTSAFFLNLHGRRCTIHVLHQVLRRHRQSCRL